MPITYNRKSTSFSSTHVRICERDATPRHCIQILFWFNTRIISLFSLYPYINEIPAPGIIFSYYSGKLKNYYFIKINILL